MTNKEICLIKLIIKAGNVKITLHCADGSTKVLKESPALQEAEVIDATKLSVKALCEFFEKEIQDCFDRGTNISAFDLVR